MEQTQGRPPKRLSSSEKDTSLSLTTLMNSSKSSDSTAKRYKKAFYKTIKGIPIGHNITEAERYRPFYNAIKDIHILKKNKEKLYLNDDITEKLFLSNFKEYIKELHRDREIPDKYRYPLRDDNKYKYVLRKELPKGKLNNYLCGNTSPGVFEELDSYPYQFLIDWSLLAKHPDAFHDINVSDRIKQLKKETMDVAFWNRFWSNLCENTDPIVIKFIEKKIIKEKKEYGKEYNKKRIFTRALYNILAKNPTPEAIELVKQRIMYNKIPYDIEGDVENIELYTILSTNPTQEAVNILNLYMRPYYDIPMRDYNSANIQMFWRNLLANPAAMKLIPKYNGDSDEYNCLQKNPNPKAFELLEKKLKNFKYNYNYLSENPSSRAIKILKKRMEEEKSLTEKEYSDLLSDRFKSGLINWDKISKNPRAQSLILAKIKEEEGKEKEIEEYKNSKVRNVFIQHYEKYLNWDYVSANPAIFKRIIKMTEEKAKKIELYLHPNTEVDKNLKLKSELKQKIGGEFSSDITDKIISILNIGSVDELISINPVIFSIKLFKIFPEKNEQGNSQRQKLKELITKLKTKF